MNLFPRVITKRLSECEPGELVRVDLRGTVTALVAVLDTQKYLVALSPMEGLAAQGAYFTPVNNWDKETLSYGKDFSVELDQELGKQHLRVGQVWEQPGAVLLSGDRLILWASAMPGLQHYGTECFDLESGQLVDSPRPERCAVFTKWSLTIPGSAETRITLTSFG